eukprot:GDKJ01064661.1.p1 GENE.GDKJ01064661.1~~GDKJ01064661.1.p1  ORF type:complete len:963 (+),score=241.65 GDKJ01064661.1:422-2890(+)
MKQEGNSNQDNNNETFKKKFSHSLLRERKRREVDPPSLQEKEDSSSDYDYDHMDASEIVRRLNEKPSRNDYLDYESANPPPQDLQKKIKVFLPPIESGDRSPLVKTLFSTPKNPSNDDENPSKTSQSSFFEPELSSVTITNLDPNPTRKLLDKPRDSLSVSARKPYRVPHLSDNLQMEISPKITPHKPLPKYAPQSALVDRYGAVCGVHYSYVHDNKKKKALDVKPIQIPSPSYQPIASIVKEEKLIISNKNDVVIDDGMSLQKAVFSNNHKLIDGISALISAATSTIGNAQHSHHSSPNNAITHPIIAVSSSLSSPFVDPLADPTQVNLWDFRNCTPDVDAFRPFAGYGDLTAANKNEESGNFASYHYNRNYAQKTKDTSQENSTDNSSFGMHWWMKPFEFLHPQSNRDGEEDSQSSSSESDQESEIMSSFEGDLLNGKHEVAVKSGPYKRDFQRLEWSWSQWDRGEAKHNSSDKHLWWWRRFSESLELKRQHEVETESGGSLTQKRWSWWQRNSGEEGEHTNFVFNEEDFLVVSRAGGLANQMNVTAADMKKWREKMESMPIDGRRRSEKKKVDNNAIHKYDAEGHTKQGMNQKLFKNDAKDNERLLEVAEEEDKYFPLPVTHPNAHTLYVLSGSGGKRDRVIFKPSKDLLYGAQVYGFSTFQITPENFEVEFISKRNQKLMKITKPMHPHRDCIQKMGYLPNNLSDCPAPTKNAKRKNWTREEILRILPPIIPAGIEWKMNSARRTATRIGEIFVEASHIVRSTRDKEPVKFWSIVTAVSIVILAGFTSLVLLLIWDFKPVLKKRLSTAIHNHELVAIR